MFESTRKRVRVRAWRGRRDAPTVVAMTSRAPAPAARVLLTGFEPFGGDVHNPSIAAARDAVGILADRGVTAEAVELPCAFGAAGSALTAALDRVRPEVAIAVGLAGGTATVRVERVAVNLQDARIPDNAGEQPVDRPVRADGPAALFATLPAKRAVAAIREAGVAAEPSLSAGAFVCNHVMYSLLDGPGTARAAGFIHVPWDTEHRPTPDTPFSVLTKGTLLARDVPLLQAASRQVPVQVSLSLAMLDPAIAAAVEPGTPSPTARLRLIERLAAAGADVTVMAMPLLPWLTDGDREIDALMRALADAGAARVMPGALHLRPGAKEWYLDWIRREHPDLLAGYEQMYARSAYAPESYRRMLTRVAGEAAARHGLARGGAHGIRREDGPTARRTPAPRPSAPAAQPALF